MNNKASARARLSFSAIALLTAVVIIVALVRNISASPPHARSGLIIGNLGGVPVAIPRAYAHFVEYDGDPYFMESRDRSPPKRTYHSRIRSFGFEIRYPDMAPLTDQTERQKKTENIYTTTWLFVGINSNSHYAGDNPLESHINYIVSLEQKIPPYRYTKSPDTTYGLTVYIPEGFDESKRSNPVTASYDDRNVYFHRNPNGEADVYIECSNVTHAAGRCKLRFNTAPLLRANISVSFRKGLLPHWQEIQSSVTKVILGFRADQSSPAQGK
ncbi:hypothetical protein [Noviherbaspirillum sp.]|jgi:hypothetical protein|uniref:hypothetical protein n=1 Tax=Noviherbaspirillum sp. TaxID=1926288 RepID=UPI0025F50B73|nr:hypothetical protein [Noviherbaspirillum sp.]